MNPSEFADLCGRVAAWWPHAKWPKDSAALYFADVKDLHADQVATAAEALYRDGRQFPPTGAQIRAAVLALSDDLPTWTEVWEALHRAASLHGHRDQEGAMELLTGVHPAVAELAAALPFRDFCLTTEVNVLHGQARRQWEQLVARRQRNHTLIGLNPAGLPALERAHGEVVEIGAAIEKLALKPGDPA